MMKRLWTYAFASLVVCAVPLAASAQSVNSLEARLDRMEREMQTLSRSVFRGDVPPPQISGPASADTAATEMRMSRMEETLRTLTGQIEEQGYQIRQMESRLNDFMAQTGERLNTSSTPSSSRTMTSDIDGDSIRREPLGDTAGKTGNTAVTSEPYRLGTLRQGGGATSPAGLYDEAFSHLQTNNYSAAEESFRRFVDTYPDHSLAANAKYWLGETYYARDDYDAAARAFARAYQDHPDGQKAPDTLLKLGMSLHNRGMTDEACLTLSELQKRFPDAPAVVLSKAGDEAASYGCSG